jgi:hypothetical protein
VITQCNLSRDCGQMLSSFLIARHGRAIRKLKVESRINAAQSL